MANGADAMKSVNRLTARCSFGRFLFFLLDHCEGKGQGRSHDDVDLYDANKFIRFESIYSFDNVYGCVL
jgi:hypothetical protein